MIKRVRLEDYNYDFDTTTGFFARWGKTKQDDPQMSPIGNEILDIEITDSCSGVSGIGPCRFCYKSNNPNGRNMSFETFKTIFDKLPPNTTQIAFGLDSSCTANPDTFKIMEYTRSKGVVPNVTVAEISEETAEKLASLCGAVAVSHYDTEICKRSISYLYKYGLKQINIHQLLSLETKDNTYKILNEYKNIPGLKAIVLLSLKQKGRGENFGILPYTDFTDIVTHAMTNNIPIGFDSCTAHKFTKYIRESENKDLLLQEQFVEPCESMLFSIYIDVLGMVYPCSFSPGSKGWEEGLDAVNCSDFLNDIWFHPKMEQWRTTLLSGNRKCPLYKI